MLSEGPRSVAGSAMIYPARAGLRSMSLKVGPTTGDVAARIVVVFPPEVVGISPVTAICREGGKFGRCVELRDPDDPRVRQSWTNRRSSSSVESRLGRGRDRRGPGGSGKAVVGLWRPALQHPRAGLLNARERSLTSQ